MHNKLEEALAPLTDEELPKLLEHFEKNQNTKDFTWSIGSSLSLGNLITSYVTYTDEHGNYRSKGITPSSYRELSKLAYRFACEFDEVQQRKEAARKKEMQAGLYSKYIVSRGDGSSAPGGKHEHCEYFVLDMRHDPYAIPALQAYAAACQDKFPVLAEDLRSRAESALAHKK